MVNASTCNAIYRCEQREDAELMLDIAEQVRSDNEEAAEDLEERVVKRIGRRQAIIIKVERSVELSSEDLEYIKDNLK